jgi:hypothetical protein
MAGAGLELSGLYELQCLCSFLPGKMHRIDSSAGRESADFAEITSN